MSGLDLEVVGNSHVAALINQHGRIVWYCLPRLDGDPVFCSLLKNDPEGRDQGFADVVVEDFASATQCYQRNSAILTTTLTDHAAARCKSPTSRRASSNMTASSGRAC